MSLYRMTCEKFQKGENSGLIGDRKSVLTDGSDFGYNTKVLIYRKAMIREVKRGDDAMAPGYLVVMTLQSFKNFDGFIVAIEK